MPRSDALCVTPAAGTCPCTSTPPRVGSWRRSCTPELLWDFRLAAGALHQRERPQVRARVPRRRLGHLARSRADLPKELIFEVDYLGGSHANFGLNFSRGASQIVAQYYNLIRLGRPGYTDIMLAPGRDGALVGRRARPAGRASRSSPPGPTCRSSASAWPTMSPFSVFDLSDRLRLRGWVVPAYRMAADAESVAVLRIVVREGLSRDMAECLVVRHRPPPSPTCARSRPMPRRGADPRTATVPQPQSAAAASRRRRRRRVPATARRRPR